MRPWKYEQPIEDENSFLSRITGQKFQDLQPMSDSTPLDNQPFQFKDTKPNLEDENSFLSRITGQKFQDLQPMSNNSPMDVNPDLPFKVEEQKVNPKIVEAMKAAGRIPTSEPPVQQDMPSSPKPVESPEVAEKVSPWAAFFSGAGQAMQGRPVDLRWATGLNSERAKALQDKLNKKSEEDRRAQAAILDKEERIEDVGFRNRQQTETERKNKAEENLASDKQKAGKGPKEMSAEVQKRYDSTAMGYSAVQDMTDALNSGENTFSIKGDNRFTEANRRFAEALGRLQSGGAISKEENENFKKMAPTILDSAEMKALKLKHLNAEFTNRLKTLGKEPSKSSGPQPGDVEGGHTFLGGDPADPKNWRQ